jgi:hypothetical protein
MIRKEQGLALMVDDENGGLAQKRHTSARTSA